MSVQIDTGDSPDVAIATESVGGAEHQRVIIETSEGAGQAVAVSSANPLPVRQARIADTANFGPVAAGAASTEVLAPDPNRRVVAVWNDGAAKVYLAIGEAAVAGKGIPLPAGAGILLDAASADVDKALNAIRTGGADVNLCGYSG